jgi:hypothetical protein
MEITDEKVKKLCLNINTIRRRNIINIDSEYLNSIKFIDPFDHASSLLINTNNLVLGKRGSGKTTLLLSSINRQKNTTVVVKDCQVYRNYDKNKIIIESIICILKKLNTNVKLHNSANKIEEKFKKNYKGFSSFFKAVTFSRDKATNDLYQQYIQLFESISFLEKLLNDINDLPQEIEYTVKEDIQNNEKETSKKDIDFNGSASLNMNTPNYYNSIKGKLELTSNIRLQKNKESSKQSSKSIRTEYKEKFNKTVFLENLKTDISDLFNQTNSFLGTKIVCYYDDFYYTELNIQPWIIQYLLDISKAVKNHGFCFKIGAIPNRIRLNEREQVDFSFKDDIPPIKLDRELSDLENLKNYLINIISIIADEYNITKDEILRLFNNDSVLIHTIIATGGIPRDFLMAFTELINLTIADNSKTIQKKHVYSFVSDLREDKANNIEVDTDISPKEIRDKIEVLKKEVIDNLKTNVILYPTSKVKEHEKIIKNLINLRYLHLISENISSDKRKNTTFNAYLIDMTFYTGNVRLRQNFDFRQFWVRDNASRLTELHNSKIWYYGMEN